MQLIYGVLDEIRKFEFVDRNYKLEINQATVFDAEWFQKLEIKLNEFLCEHKEKIIFKTFNKQIPIERLYIRFESFNNRIDVRVCEKKKSAVIVKENTEYAVDTEALEDEGWTVRVRISYHVEGINCKEANLNFIGAARSINSIQQIVMKYMIQEILGLEYAGSKGLIYLPASRTGLLSVYRHILANLNEKLVNVEEDSAGYQKNQIVKRNLIKNL